MRGRMGRGIVWWRLGGWEVEVFVLPKSGVFPPSPRPKVGAARVGKDVRVDAGAQGVSYALVGD